MRAVNVCYDKILQFLSDVPVDTRTPANRLTCKMIVIITVNDSVIVIAYICNIVAA